MKHILFCVGYSKNNDDKRDSAISARTIADYIMSIMNNFGYYVTVVSATKNVGDSSILRQEKIKLNQNELVLSPALGGKGRISEGFKTIFLNLWLAAFLLKNTKKDDEVFVYHGINKIPALLLVKKIHRLSYIMYVGEIYHNISKHGKIAIAFEKLMLKKADKYVFSSPFLEKKINVESKPSMVLSGAYVIPQRYAIQRVVDEKINIVYAGIIDSKKGAYMLCDVAKYLPVDYCIHIAGYGTDEDIHGLENKIAQIREKSVCSISYDGLLSGEEYYRYLQSCHIGICPQITDSKYNESSFPSKISVYMSNGLSVLVPNIKGIREHELGKSLYYYDIDSPDEIAKAIMNIDLSDSFNSRLIIEQMHEKAVKELGRLIDG